MSTIERLEELDAKATDAPWKYARTHKSHNFGEITDGDGCIVLQDCGMIADGPLICAMRNSLPSILRVVRIVQAHCESGDYDPTHPTDAAMKEAMNELERTK